MEEIETKATSSKTVEVTPVPLRSSDQVRLVFLPTLVDNDEEPRACIRGEFVYQRKGKKDTWEPTNSLSLGTIKKGEAYKLELRSGELLRLVESLGPLYRLKWKEGLPQGKQTFVKVEAGLSRFLELGEGDLRAFLDTHKDAAVTTLLKLVSWLASSETTTAAAERLAGLSQDRLPAVTALIGLANLRSALDFWSANRNNVSEEFWQTALSERPYLFSQVTSYPVVVVHEKAYVGGKLLDNSGGGVVDFLAKTISTDALVLIEIKTPQTRLLGKEYRAGVYPFSPELSGAIAQILHYRQQLMRNFAQLKSSDETRVVLGDPRCIVIAGCAADELDSESHRNSFEMQRHRVHGVSVITFDELFGHIRQSIAILETQNGSQ
jgi:hypothetical protein